MPEPSVKINDHLVIICGQSASGKSQSLSGLKNPEGVLYLNTESGKRLPFKNTFNTHVITDPLEVLEAFDQMLLDEHYHTIVIDSATYLMDMYESLYVRTSTNGQKAWGDFAQFWKDLMQIKVAKSNKNVIFTGHTLDTLNEATHVMETKIPIKGSLKNQGLESYFSCVVASKKMTLKSIESYESELLNISDEDRNLGFKYVFQTRLTKETVGERIRSPIDLFTAKETFIDNNIQLVMDRLIAYYAD